MPGALAILGLAAARTSAYGTYMQGRTGQANYNARLLKQNAVLTEQAMRSETRLMQERGRRLKATQRATAAKMGADISSGTPLLVMVEQAGDIQRDILEQRRNRMIEATRLRAGAEMKRYEGRMAKRARTIGAFSTILGGTARFASLGGGTAPSTSAPLPGQIDTRLSGMPINRSYGAV